MRRRSMMTGRFSRLVLVSLLIVTYGAVAADSLGATTAASNRRLVLVNFVTAGTAVRVTLSRVPSCVPHHPSPKTFLLANGHHKVVDVSVDNPAQCDPNSTMDWQLTTHTRFHVKHSVLAVGGFDKPVLSISCHGEVHCDATNPNGDFIIVAVS